MDGLPGLEAGGIAGLVAFLREYGAAAEADLQRYYNTPLSDLTCGRLTWRRLAVLLGELPHDCAIGRAMHGDDAEWGISEHLLAAVFDSLQVGNWQRAGDPKASPPVQTKRPGVKDTGRLGNAKGLDPVQVRARLARLKQGTEVTGDGV